jgi:hypothetical protein
MLDVRNVEILSSLGINARVGEVDFYLTELGAI